jgi:HD-GYP domain-containing protein (c-di-GMP phosphodiesterase class II)
MLGLKGAEIPVECRIMAIVDAYDAMTNDRPYRKAMSHEDAVAEPRRCAGTYFDPEHVDLFLDIL